MATDHDSWMEVVLPWIEVVLPWKVVLAAVVDTVTVAVHSWMAMGLDSSWTDHPWPAKDLDSWPAAEHYRLILASVRVESVAAQQLFVATLIVANSVARLQVEVNFCDSHIQSSAWPWQIPTCPIDYQRAHPPCSKWPPIVVVVHPTWRIIPRPLVHRQIHPRRHIWEIIPRNVHVRWDPKNTDLV